MTVGLTISRLINVTVNLQALAAASVNFDTCLVLGTSSVIDTVERKRVYSTLAAVEADFGGSAEEYLAAVRWFGQSPQPNSLTIGKWAKTATNGRLVCGSLPAAYQSASAWTGITAGAFKIGIDGGAAADVTGMNFSAQTTMSGIAVVITTKLTGATCTYDAVNNRFIITSATTGASSAISFLAAPASGTDISATMLGRSTSSGAYVANGIAAETALAAVTLFNTNYSDQWYGLVIPAAADSDHLAVAAFIEGTTAPHLYGLTQSEAATLNSGDTTNISYLLQQAAYNHTVSQYSSSDPYAVMSLFAKMLTVNWTANNTALTAMYKTEPGVTAETLSETQATNVASYNANVFVKYNNSTSIIQYGVCASGQFIDTIIGSDWLKSAIQTNVYNILYQSATKIPQTDSGMHQLATAIESACAQGVTNGLLAPGTWSGSGFGQIKTGDWLPKGYYVYAPPVSSQSATSRAARVSVPFQVAAHLAGAVHTANIQINLAS